MAARLHAKIHGLVQGVGFRYFTLKQATRLGVTGWVRNTDDGGVEVVAEGARDKLEQLLQYLKQGPPTARVEHIHVEWEEDVEPVHQSFDIRLL